MEWFEKSPGALRLAFTFGVGLTSAFAATVIPGWGQFTLFGFGALLMLGSLFWAGYIFFRRVTVDPRAAQSQFTPIWQAIQRVALINGEAKNTDYFPKAREIIRQAALDGEIVIRGRKQIGSIESVRRTFDTVFVDIPRSYWEEFKISAYASVENKYVSNPYTSQLSRGSGSHSFYYAELQVRNSDLERCWPFSELRSQIIPQLEAKRTLLEIRLKIAREAVKARLADRVHVEEALNRSPSPETSDAYKRADQRLGEAYREHDAARDEFLRIGGLLPEESSHMTAYEAIRYLVDESEWGRQIHAAVGSDKSIDPRFGMRKQPLLEALIEFQRAAESGAVAIVGRKNGIGDLEPIPSFYWASAILDPTCIYNRSVSETKASDSNPEGISIYTSIRISRNDVYEAWPRETWDE